MFLCPMYPLEDLSVTILVTYYINNYLKELQYIFFPVTTFYFFQ